VPGYRGVIEDLSADGIHMNNRGSYLVACTFYAIIFRKDPAGLPAKCYQLTNQRLVRIMHRSIWDGTRG
jgi:hypothetical protein